MAPFEVTSQRETGRLVVHCAGELDIATAPDVRAKLAARGADDLVLDLSGLEFLDTSGIQLVVEAHRASQEEGFGLTIVKAPPQVQRVFEIAGLGDVLPFEEGDG